MHAIGLARLSVTLCLSAKSLLDECPRLCDDSLAEHWASSRCRVDEWGRAIRRMLQLPSEELSRYELAGLAEDILVAQLHTRIVAALAVLHDQRRGSEVAGPIARNTLIAHQEAVTRLTALINRAAAIDGLTLRLSGLGSLCKRWNDLLLGYLLPLGGAPGSDAPGGHAIEFAFDAQRAVEFAYDAQSHLKHPLVRLDPLLGASLEQAFSPPQGQALRPDLNRRIAAATLGMFGPEAFDDFGMLRSTWIGRMSQTTDEALALVEMLFDETTSTSRGQSRV